MKLCHSVVQSYIKKLLSLFAFKNLLSNFVSRCLKLAHIILSGF